MRFAPPITLTIRTDKGAVCARCLLQYTWNELTAQDGVGAPVSLPKMRQQRVVCGTACQNMPQRPACRKKLKT